MKTLPYTFEDVLHTNPAGALLSTPIINPVPTKVLQELVKPSVISSKGFQLPVHGLGENRVILSD